MFGKWGVGVVGVASGREVFFRLYGQRLELIAGCGFFFVLGVLFWREVGWSMAFCWDCHVVEQMMR